MPCGDRRRHGFDCLGLRLAIRRNPASLAWVEIGPTSLVRFRAVVEDRVGAAVWQMFDAWLLPQPAFAVLLSLALILWMIGYKKPSPAGRFAA